MYFSVSEIKSDRAAQLAVMAANDVGERMLAGEQSAVAFESAIANMSRRTGIDTSTLAAQLLAQEADYRKKAIKVGMTEIVKMLGGEQNANDFFRQIALPRASIRFDSVGSIRDDVMSAKNRATLLAIRAGFERKLDPKGKYPLQNEQRYLDFVKSVHRTLSDSKVAPGLANGIAKEINAAALADIPADLKVGIMAIQDDAAHSVAQETRERIVARYQKAEPTSPTPTMH